MKMLPVLTSGNVASLHKGLYYLRESVYKNRQPSYCITKTMIYEKKDLCFDPFSGDAG